MTATIVVPLDGSERALVAFPVARRLAELGGYTLHVVHVARDERVPAEVLPQIGLVPADLRGLVLDSKAGDPAAGILEVAGEATDGLIVMCTHTSLPAAGKTVGRTALAVLEGARCPVVLVRPERGVAPWTLGRILLPHDGTPVTSAAVRPAIELARTAAAEVDVLQVAAPGAPPPAARGSLQMPRYLDQPQHEWPAWVDEFIDRVSCICALDALTLRMAVAHGSPGEEVLRFAGQHASDLIVLAWGGNWAEGHAATVKSVLHGAVAPVMVIHAHDQQPRHAASR
jgi:nucleotide-binding universal stress UspA family protein